MSAAERAEAPPTAGGPEPHRPTPPKCQSRTSQQPSPHADSKAPTGLAPVVATAHSTAPAAGKTEGDPAVPHCQRHAFAPSPFLGTFHLSLMVLLYYRYPSQYLALEGVHLPYSGCDLKQPYSLVGSGRAPHQPRHQWPPLRQESHPLRYTDFHQFRREPPGSTEEDLDSTTAIRPHLGGR
jgi:hypothetical protein